MNLPWQTLRLTSSILERNLFTSSYVSAKRRVTVRKPVVYSKPPAPPIGVWPGIRIKDLAKIAKRPIDDVFEAICFADSTINYEHVTDPIAEDDLKKVVTILGFSMRTVPVPKSYIEPVVKKQIADAVPQPPPPAAELKPRRPVVTVMGHVDHGKTTLLDTLRNSRIVDEEFGGITQHIGAFSVKVPQCKQGAITFLDTPGHAAFSAMRARGANVTDMVVLVVAADDGVMEQTVESIRFANEAEVPIIVAINKMDKPGADPEHAKKGLLGCGIQADSEGGDVQFVPVSALKGQGIEQLLEAIVLQGELLALQTTFEGPTEGYVIESLAHEHRGKLCTLLVKRGTLKKGNIVVAGTAWCKVRSLFDEWGKPMQQVEPGCAAQVTGWRSLPTAGDLTLEVASEQRAREVVQLREERRKTEKLEIDAVQIDERMSKERAAYIEKREAGRAEGYHAKRWNELRKKEIVEDNHPTLRVVIKGDTDGSVEALLDILETYDRQDDCRLDVLHYGVGPVTVTDLELAQAFNGIVYAMHVGIHQEAKLAAKKSEVKQFKVIYKLIEDLKAQISERLPMTDAEEILGEARVLQEFLINEKRKKIPVAGCRCVKGDLFKAEFFKLMRNGEEVYCGKMVSMKHLKSEVKSIKTNVECGLMFDDPTVRFQQDDLILCVRKFKVNQKTAWNPRGF